MKRHLYFGSFLLDYNVRFHSMTFNVLSRWWVGFLWLMLFGFLFHGCGKSGTVDSIPVNSYVNITGVTLDTKKVAVSVQWEYEGMGAIQAFHIFRKIGDQDSPIGLAVRHHLDGDGIELTGRLVFQDLQPIAGEQAEYRVDLITGSGEPVRSRSFLLRVPGVLIQDAQPQEALSSIQLTWALVDEGILSYEVFRQIGDETPRSIYVPEDLSKTVFVDGPLIGNREYTYVIRSFLTGGRTLESRPQKVGLYPFVYSRAVTPAVADRVRLNWFGLTSVGVEMPMACVFSTSKIQIHQLDYQVIATQFDTGNKRTYMIGTDTNAEVVDLPFSDLNPITLSFTGPSAHQPNAPVFITGVDIGEQVVVKAFVPSSPTSFYDTPVSASTPWPAEGKDVRTASYYSGSGHLFVSVGKLLKVFDKDFQEVGLVQLEGIPYDLLEITGNMLWVSFPEENRLMFGTIAFDQDGRLLQPIWQNVVLPSHARPMGLDFNVHEQVVVLDGGNNQVLILDSQGRSVTHIEDLIGPFDQDGKPEGDIMTGISSQGKISVYVVNADGRLFFYGDNSL